MKIRKQGFTLIELLVVIAIIAILAAILFPVFAQAREKARQTQCASNLKQIALATLQYTQDYDEFFPMAWQGTYSAPTATLLTFLDPYIKASQVWICPDRTKNPNRLWDYGYDASLLGGDFQNPSACALSAQQSDIRSPSNQIMFGDTMWAVYNNPGATWVCQGAATPGTTDLTQWYEWTNGLIGPIPTMWFPAQLHGPRNVWPIVGDFRNGQALSPRHGTKAMCAYVDGHVKFRDIFQVYSHTTGTNDPACEWCNGL